MKKLLAGWISLLFATSLFAQTAVRGSIIDRDGQPVIGANVYLKAIRKGGITDEKGQFQIKDVPAGTYNVSISHVGYKTATQSFQIQTGTLQQTIEFQLEKQTLALDELVVKATRVGEKVPITSSSLDKEAIEARNLGQDVPFILRWTPSAVVTSDAGTGIGYTGIRIRGSDPTRINVTINGIPLNDTESQGVFWVDLPDFASSTQDIQIQRGVGTSTNGAGAFGASINLNTGKVREKAYGEINGSFGSFNTYRGNVQFGTGLIGNRITIDGRLSKINSDGYIDRGSADLLSYFGSLAYVGDKSIFRLNVFSGQEVTYQAWNGVPAQYVNDEALRTFNTAGTEKADEPHDNEVDNYKQTHVQALYASQLNLNWGLNLALHYTKGMGFFEQYKAEQSLEDYNILNANVLASDLIRRRWLDNDFYGSTFSLTYTSDSRKLESIVGGAWNQYLGGHFGETIWTAATGAIENPPLYYDNDATKTDFNVYTKFNYALAGDLNAYLDLQYRTVDYEFLGFDNEGNNLTQNDQLHFFNPKLGLFYDLGENTDLYASFGVANREPNRNDYTETTPESRPQHETLYNTEIGYRQNWKKAALNVNLYHMFYNNQLVLTGKINDVGAYTRVNVDRSYRAGIELVGGFDIYKGLSLGGNATFSQNRIQSFTEFIDSWDAGGQEMIAHENTNLAFSPNVIAGIDLTYDVFKNSRRENKSSLTFSILNKYVSQQYLDNTSNENTVLDAYFFSDFNARFTTSVGFFKEVSINLLVRNLFNNQFSTNGWTYRYISAGYDGRADDPFTRLESGDTYNLTGFYPQAGTNFLLGVGLKF
ncbi:MAG: TonB-dependent receptor [Bacteroidota bacterium]